MFLGDHVELVTSEDSLESFDLGDPTGTKGDSSSFVEFLIISNALVLWIFIDFRLGNDDRTCTTKFVFVLNLNDAAFFVQVAL
jgi:hypothetical protein